MHALGQQRVRLPAAGLEDALARLLVDHEVPDVGDFRARVLRMGVVDVVARAVHQRLVAGDVLLLVRRVLLAVDLEAPGVGQGILLVVVPQDLAGVVFAVGVDEENAARDGIEVGITLDGDPVLDLRPHHLRNGHPSRSPMPAAL